MPQRSTVHTMVVYDISAPVLFHSALMTFKKMLSKPNYSQILAPPRIASQLGPSERILFPLFRIRAHSGLVVKIGLALRLCPRATSQL